MASWPFHKVSAKQSCYWSSEMPASNVATEPISDTELQGKVGRTLELTGAS